jgi:RNA polymerase sigma-70 factor (ECF subfamily)
MHEPGDHGQITDERLVERYRESPHGPEGRAALETLAARWRTRVYLWALRMLRERELALDIAHDCFVQMLGALDRYENRGRFGAWLFSIVHSCCLHELRRRRPVATDDATLERLAGSAPGVDREVGDRIELARVLEVMNRVLEPEERLALWLRAREETSVDELTRVLGLENASGARALLQTARRKLRAAMDAGERERRP